MPTNINIDPGAIGSLFHILASPLVGYPKNDDPSKPFEPDWGQKVNKEAFGVKSSDWEEHDLNRAFDTFNANMSGAYDTFLKGDKATAVKAVLSAVPQMGKILAASGPHSQTIANGVLSNSINMMNGILHSDDAHKLYQNYLQLNQPAELIPYSPEEASRKLEPGQSQTLDGNLLLRLSPRKQAAIKDLMSNLGINSFKEASPEQKVLLGQSIGLDMYDASTNPNSQLGALNQYSDLVKMEGRNGQMGEGNIDFSKIRPPVSELEKEAMEFGYTGNFYPNMSKRVNDQGEVTTLYDAKEKDADIRRGEIYSILPKVPPRTQERLAKGFGLKTPTDNNLIDAYYTMDYDNNILDSIQKALEKAGEEKPKLPYRDPITGETKLAPDVSGVFSGWEGLGNYLKTDVNFLNWAGKAGLDPADPTYAFVNNMQELIRANIQRVMTGLTATTKEAKTYELIMGKVLQSSPEQLWAAIERTRSIVRNMAVGKYKALADQAQYIPMEMRATTYEWGVRDPYNTPWEKYPEELQAIKKERETLQGISLPPSTDIPQEEKISPEIIQMAQEYQTFLDTKGIKKGGYETLSEQVKSQLRDEFIQTRKNK